MNFGAVPARNAPAFVRDLVEAWQAASKVEDFHQFIDGEGAELARGLVERHQEQPLSGKNNDFFRDWDAKGAFSLAGRGQGECSAGVFDLIEVDLANARESLEAGRLYASAHAASHALLVTKGLQPKSERETFELFERHFIGEGLVEETLRPAVTAGIAAAGGGDPAASFAGSPGSVTLLVAGVRVLYEGMDSSLRFGSAK
jgi:sulfite reductase (ferredoxin)